MFRCIRVEKETFGSELPKFGHGVCDNSNIGVSISQDIFIIWGLVRIIRSI
jgi:hypothetical protein